MRPLLALLLALAACTTTVPEPDATVPAPDWRDAALVEAIASDAVTAQHRLGSAGPISLPASFLTAGGDLATGGVVTQAQSGALSFSSTGQVACSAGTTGCQFKQATKASDTATNGLSIQAQSAFASATVNPGGATLTLAGGASAGGAITATGGGVVLQGGTSAATTSGTAGSVTALLGVPVGTGSESYFYVDRGSSLGTHMFAAGDVSGGTIAGIWLGLGATAPTTTNATIKSNSGYTQINGSTGDSFLVNGVYEGLFQSGLAEFGSTGAGSAFGGTNVLILDNGTSPTSSPTSGAVLTSVSGALTVTPTGNTTPAMTVAPTVTNLATTLAAGYAAVTPVNGANALSAANSAVANLNLVAGATAAVTITDALTPAAAKGALLFVRNNTTQTVTFGWSSGTTITIATLTSALVTSDGTNAIKLMAGT